MLMINRLADWLLAESSPVFFPADSGRHCRLHYKQVNY